MKPTLAFGGHRDACYNRCDGPCKGCARPAVDDAKLRRTEPLEAMMRLSIDIGIIDGGTPLRRFHPAGYAPCGFGQESRLRPRLSSDELRVRPHEVESMA